MLGSESDQIHHHSPDPRPNHPSEPTEEPRRGGAYPLPLPVFRIRDLARSLSLRTGGGVTRSHGEEGGAGARSGGGDVGAAVAVGQDGLLPRLHARLAAARLRAAAPRRPARPAPPAGTPIQLPPRRSRPQRAPPLLPHRPGQGVSLQVFARRPPRRLRRPLPPHPLRVHGVRGRRGLPVGGGGVQRRFPRLRPRQGRRGLRRERRAGAAGQGPARGRRGHVPHVARARRRAPRHGVPGQQPRAAPPARRLQDRHRSREVEGSPYAKVAEAMHRMTRQGN